MIRKTCAEDRHLADEWVKSEPAHRGVFSPEFFLAPGTIAVDEGGVAMFIRMVAEPPMMRMYIQFSPGERRVARALAKNFAQVRKIIEHTGAGGMVFDSTSPRLIRFCCKAFGFQRVGETDDYQILFTRG